jgi:hypothetical protein
MPETSKPSVNSEEDGPSTKEQNDSQPIASHDNRQFSFEFFKQYCKDLASFVISFAVLSGSSSCYQLE